MHLARYIKIILLITLLSLVFGSGVNAKPASGLENLVAAPHQGETLFNPLMHQEKTDVSTIDMSGYPLGPKGVAGNPMFKSALQPFNKGLFTNAGRALTKHPNIVGVNNAADLTKLYRNQSGINKAASEALKNIMRNGVKTTKNTNAFGKVTDFKLSNGLGARFNSNTNGFIGFLGR